jgi:hypothetical protein
MRGIFGGMSQFDQIWYVMSQLPLLRYLPLLLASALSNIHSLMTVCRHHFLGWWAVRKNENVLWVCYEDMKRDLRGSVEKVAKFMDVQYDDQVPYCSLLLNSPPTHSLPLKLSPLVF